MLAKLRAKPEHIRQRVSLVATLIVFGSIVFVWLSSWDARESKKDTREKTLSPLAGIEEVFHGFVSEVKNGISSAPTYVENAHINGVFIPTATSTITTRGIITPIASSSSGFDMSGVVVIDQTASSTDAKAQF